MTLIAKYDRPGPRYTSYPTVPHWRGDFGHEELDAKLRQAAHAVDEALSLYVHLPFCASMCSYCGCNVVVSKNRDKHADYVETLVAELGLIAERLGERRNLAQIHWGGGTPTLLDEGLILRVWEGIREHFEVAKDADIAIEVDPVVTSREQLALLRGLGFRRISMGVQDFTPEVQRAVDRIQSVEQTEALATYARELGYTCLNFDLIYGLPHQRTETFAKTIDEVICMAPDRLAIFSYAHVPQLRPNQRRIDASALPVGEEKLALFRMAQEKLLAAGYVGIGMDHFAKEGDELAIALRQRRLSRNFQGYAVNPAPDTIAAGSTAISYVAGAYAQNVRPLPTYARAVAEGRLPVERGIHLTADDRLRRDAITQLMCNFHLDLRSLGERHRVDPVAALEDTLDKLVPMEADGLLDIEAGAIEVTEIGKPFIRTIAAAFDRWLDAPPRRPGARLPIHSQAI